jgi:hypothetical protein
MPIRARFLAIAAFSLFSIGEASAVPVDYDGPTYYQGSRDQLRQMCQQISGELHETSGKTRCYSIHREALYICKDSGLCQIQKWTGDSGSPMATGGGDDDGFEDSLTGSDSGSDVAGSGDSGAGGDSGGDTGGGSGGGTGDIFL